MNDQISSPETTKLLALARECLALDGDFVELGCYRGDTTVLLGELRPRHLFAYDSFSGLPAKSREDQAGAGANFQQGELMVAKKEVLAKLKRHHLTNVILKKAWFSELTPEDLPAKIAFAFIDGDFYESQKQGLKLVAPRLAQNGIIVCHDYNNPELPGASRAVDEFLRQNPQFTLAQFHTLAILRQKP